MIKGPATGRGGRRKSEGERSGKTMAGRRGESPDQGRTEERGLPDAGPNGGRQRAVLSSHGERGVSHPEECHLCNQDAPLQDGVWN